MTAPLLVTRRDAAEMLGCSERQIDVLRASGHLEAVRLTDSPTSAIRITYASLLAYVASLRAA